MTLLKIYQKNGYTPKYEDNIYKYSDLLRDYIGHGDYQATPATPRVNISEQKDSYELNLALPGIRKEEISIDFDKDVMTIAHREPGENYGEKVYNRREFNYYGFERSFSLPETVNTDKIKAKMDNGILTVILPKREDAIDRGPRDIKIS